MLHSSNNRYDPATTVMTQAEQAFQGAVSLVKYSIERAFKMYPVTYKKRWEGILSDLERAKATMTPHVELDFDQSWNAGIRKREIEAANADGDLEATQKAAGKYLYVWEKAMEGL